MSLGRRKVRLDDASSWVFNRMADVYPARPPYPAGLIDALTELALESGGPILDLGAGIGHLALPLAARGLEVIAVEPAHAMLAELERAARARELRVRAIHAAAEALPLDAASVGLVVVADAVHFLDREHAAAEIARVLGPRGALAIVTCDFAPTPFMRGLVEIMEAAAPRRPRAVAPSIAQLGAIARVRLGRERRFDDETPLDPPTLERVLRSISFIGPAMNPERFAAFRARVQALPGSPVWARTLRLYAGRRGRDA